MPSIRNILQRIAAPLLAVLLCVCSISAFSQSLQKPGTLRGVIQDSATGLQLANTTVEVYQQGNNTPVRTLVSKHDGSFEVPRLPPGRYSLSLHVIGYKPRVFPLPRTTAAPVNLGVISLLPSMNELKEARVTAKKILVEQDIDKISYNVDADPESRTSNLLDIMRKVPMLSVNGDNNIALNGSTSYRVLINGKTSSLFVREPSEVFRSMPASLVKKIEVLTNPPSRYDGEGLGGIINIITHRRALAGYHGSINAGAVSPPGITGGGFITAGRGKLGLSANFGYNASTSPVSTNHFFRNDKINRTRMEQSGESSSESKFSFIGVELSYEMDSLNLLNINYSNNQNRSLSNTSQDITLANNEGRPTQGYRFKNAANNDWHGDDFGLDYQHSFRRTKDQMLTLSYKLSNSVQTSITDIVQEPLYNYENKISKTDNDNSFRENTVQADYVHPIHKHVLELGLKYISRDNGSGYSYSNLDSQTGIYTSHPSLTNDFEYRQDIFGGYTSLSLKSTYWALRIGARLEQTNVDARFKSTGTVATQDYRNLMPSFSLMRKLKGTSNITLSYNQRIERPGLFFLNPYVDKTDPRYVSYGNPGLLPAISHVFNLGYSSYFAGTSLNVGLFYNYTNNSIQRITTIGEDTVATTTFSNIGLNKNYGINFNGNSTFFKKLNVNVNGNLSFMSFTRTSYSKLYTSSGVTGSILTYLSYNFGQGWRTSANIGYNSPSLMVQGRGRGYVWHSFSANKDFLKKNKASISLGINNPFSRTRRNVTEIYDPAFYQFQESYAPVRQFTIAFTYRFGKITTDVTRKKRGIHNDDLKTGG
jgi:outer membrane receptor protein involved in Fe transport